jgi:hypothetical protein
MIHIYRVFQYNNNTNQRHTPYYFIFHLRYKMFRFYYTTVRDKLRMTWRLQDHYKVTVKTKYKIIIAYTILETCSLIIKLIAYISDKTQ